MLLLKYIFSVIIILTFLPAGECLDCFTCTNVTAVSLCKTTKTCKPGDACFAEHLQTANGVILSYGCRPVGICFTITTFPTTGSDRESGSIVGRASAISTAACSECCQDHNCNRQLCQHSYPRCADSPKANCAVIGTMMNICLDTQHAKTICRRFCGLCNYYDGSWSSWLSWSNCDVTCGNGIQTRDRTCTEPAPSGGGHDCVGPSRDTKTCALQPCPVHGGWSAWASWGSCSVTCGVGTQRRDRACSNPYPKRFGDHCFGDSRDDKICIANACQECGDN
ncbi:thrombospondin-1-like [Mercenaria mercenaria]|uniref:thrombospondin-1-like n=1 Tax=Mercenaria mercenaria TaxID=6596 RepID=UPI00234EDCEB|nr:thrombospondin-1-like [Mercenaria mercenaria]